MLITVFHPPLASVSSGPFPRFQGLQGILRATGSALAAKKEDEAAQMEGAPLANDD